MLPRRKRKQSWSTTSSALAWSQAKGEIQQAWYDQEKRGDCKVNTNRTHDKLDQSVSSVSPLCLTLCDHMNCSTPGLPVHHQLLESTQTHVHWVGEAIQPSHPLLSPSPKGTMGLPYTASNRLIFRVFFGKAQTFKRAKGRGLVQSWWSSIVDLVRVSFRTRWALLTLLEDQGW